MSVVDIICWEDVDACEIECADLTLSQIGALTRLKRAMARNGGSLPYDEKLLARLSRAGQQWKKQVSVVVMNKLEVRDGRLYSPTLGRIEYKNRPDYCVVVRRARMATAKELGTHTDEEWSAMRLVFAGCVVCNSPEMTKDHVVPVSAGGCDCIANLQPLCPSCNSRKWATDEDLRNFARPSWVQEFLAVMAS